MNIVHWAAGARQASQGGRSNQVRHCLPDTVDKEKRWREKVGRWSGKILEMANAPKWRSVGDKVLFEKWGERSEMDG